MESAARARRANLALTIGVMLMISMFGLANNYQSVVMNRVVDSFGLTGGSQGIMSTMINIGSIAAFLTAPFLQGRLKKTTVLLIACLLMAFSFSMLGFTSAYVSMLAGSTLLGIAFGWVDSNCNALMVDLHPDKSATFLGLLHGGFGVGGLMAPLLITALLAAMNWHAVSGTMAAIVLAVGLVFFVLMAVSRSAHRSAQREQPVTRADLKAYFLNGRNVLLLLAGMFYAVSQAGLLTWVVRYMTLRYDAEALGASALSIYWISATLSRFIAPRLHLPPLRAFLFGSLIAGVSLIVGVFSGSPALMLVLTGAVGLASGHCVPMLLSESTAGQTGNSSLIASAILVGMCIARTPIPVWMGAIADAVHVNAAMLVPAVGSILAAVAAAPVLLRAQRHPIV